MRPSPLAQIERITPAGIPCLWVKPKHLTSPLPWVVFYHGWSSGKDQELLKATMLASHGYQVFIPDAPNHGERGAIDHYAPGALAKYFWPTILQIVAESEAFLEALKSYPVGPGAVMGSSMGGFAGAGVFAHNPELATFISLNGCCAWQKGVVLFEADGLPAPTGEEALALLRLDPLENPDKLGERPLLMLHGQDDPVVPVLGQRWFLEHATPYYKDPSKLQLVEFPGLGHFTTLRMFEQVLSWLDRYL